MPFIQRAHKRPKGCIFCKAFREKKDKANYVLCRSPHAVAMLNIFPYNNGHLMVAPRRHTADFDAITGPEWQDIMQMVGACRKVLEKSLEPQGYNVGINMGRAGGAGIEDHLHVHLVPRWSGDGNFMPVLAGCKVMPQSLAESYSQLCAGLNSGRGRSRRSRGR